MASLIGANIQWLDLKNKKKKKTTELKFTPLSQLYFAKIFILFCKNDASWVEKICFSSISSLMFVLCYFFSIKTSLADFKYF